MPDTIVSIQVELEIPFHDVDSMGVAWHGHYAKYFELARCELLNHIDYNYNQMIASGHFWPVIDMRIRYAQPLRFQQKIVVTAKLMEYENRLKIDFVIQDKQTGRRLSKGHTIQVAVSAESGEMLFASPNALLEKLKGYLPS